MKKRGRIVVQAGPVVSRRSGSEAAGRLEVHGSERRLLPLELAAGGELAWRQEGAFRQRWWLSSERGDHLMLRREDFLLRRWRAEAASGSWTLARGWSGFTGVSDASGSVVLRYHVGWFGKGRVEPASGPDLSWRMRWLAAFSLDTGEGHELLRLRRRRALLRTEAAVELSEAVRERADLVPLLALTWLVALAASRR